MGIFTKSLMALALVPVLASSQEKGVYQPSTGDPVAWEVNENHALLWGGQPYVPIGIRIDGSNSSIEMAKNAGIKDVIVELATGMDWNSTISALEAAQIRYIIQISSASPAAKGFVIDPQRFRIPSLKVNGVYGLSLPGIKEAYVALVSNRDGSVVHEGIMQVQDGKLIFDKDFENGIEFTLYVYPRGGSLAQVDSWEAFDSHRDRLLSTLKKTKFGPGLRGILNPLGESVSLRPEYGAVVPDSNYFRMELSQYLANKYRNVSTALKTWNVGSSAIDSFDQMARLVPLWSGGRGAMIFWDPVDQMSYRCNSKNSNAWTDITTVLDSAAVRRCDRLARSVRLAVNVPVIQDWKGWSSQYEVAKPALSGLGLNAYGTSIADILTTGATGASSVMRWGQPGWILSTDITLMDRETLGARDVVAELTALGSRGFFFKPHDLSWVQQVAETQPEPGITSWTPKPIFFPENAAYPAIAQKLPGGAFWYPAPFNGNLVDLGSQFHAYRFSRGGESFTALWSSGGAGRVKLRMLSGKQAIFTTLDGVDPKPKVVKNGVEVFVNQFPMIIRGTDEVPIPEISLLESVNRFDQLVKLSEKTNREISQETFTFKDCTQGFDRGPFGNMSTMRSMYWRATLKLAPYSWVEAENCKSHNFSEALAMPGATGNGALVLRSIDAGNYQAEFNVPIRTEEDQMVWVAGRFSDEDLKDVVVRVGNQVLLLERANLGVHGRGLTWYRAGLTQLKIGNTKVSVEITGNASKDAVLDAIMIAPQQFVPRGSTPPEIVDVSQK